MKDCVLICSKGKGALFFCTEKGKYFFLVLQKSLSYDLIG